MPAHPLVHYPDLDATVAVLMNGMPAMDPRTGAPIGMSTNELARRAAELVAYEPAPS